MKIKEDCNLRDPYTKKNKANRGYVRVILRLATKKTGLMEDMKESF